MSKSKSKLNGSVESLALSLHNVISEAVEVAVEKGNESMMDEMVAMENRINKRMDTTDQNTSKQFAAQAKYISEEIDKKLSR